MKFIVEVAEDGPSLGRTIGVLIFLFIIIGSIYQATH